MTFGEFIRTLRLERRWSKEDLCGDEACLSVRQLTRLESGHSKPTLAKIEFIASRLAIPTYQLMKYYVALPQDYLDLKYLALRLSAFGQEEKLDEMAACVEEMAERFYEQLPEDERVIIWILRCRIRMCRGIKPTTRTQIFDDYLEQVQRRKVYSINDLLLIHVYFLACQLIENLLEEPFYRQMVDCLLEQDQHLKIEEWFILRDVLIACLTVGLQYGLAYKHREMLALLEQMMELTQDYQKKAVVYLLEWKCAMMFRQDVALARKFYQQALAFSHVLRDTYLRQQLMSEWESDWQGYGK